MKYAGPARYRDVSVAVGEEAINMDVGPKSNCWALSAIMIIIPDLATPGDII